MGGQQAALARRAQRLANKRAKLEKRFAKLSYARLTVLADRAVEKGTLRRVEETTLEQKVLDLLSHDEVAGELNYGADGSEQEGQLTGFILEYGDNET